MAVNGQAVDANNRALLNPDEIDRLQRFYGTVDPETRKVKTRMLSVPLCGSDRRLETIWVWDWVRSESPTEPQFRSLVYKTGCDDENLRRTLLAVFEEARKEKVPFADLIYRQILAAKAQEDSQSTGRPRR